MDRGELRALILGLPEVEEYEHGDLPAFRVRGKRFASMLDDEGVNLMPGTEGIRAAVASWPEVCVERWFAQRLTAVHVKYTVLAREAVEDIVEDAWAARAPKTLVRELQASRGRDRG